MSIPPKNDHYFDLVDFRRKVAKIYSQVRDNTLPIEVRWKQFCKDRNALFKYHSQSALSSTQRKHFTGLSYFPYNPDFCISATLEFTNSQEILEIPLQTDGVIQIQRFAKVLFSISQQPFSLSLFWIMGYGGGIFLPFRDQSNKDTTFPGGRYLFDTIKLADPGIARQHLELNFNFAYNPSCAYNDRWHCPLAPSENWLSIPIFAGEKRYR